MSSENSMSAGNPIVMVDDSVTDLDIARLFYKHSGLPNPLVTFSNGKAFLDYMREVEAKGANFPLVALIDVNMPKFSGYDTLSELRLIPAFVEKPKVVMLSNSDSRDDVEKSKRLGADGFQVKPFSGEEYNHFFSSLVGVT